MEIIKANGKCDFGGTLDDLLPNCSQLARDLTKSLLVKNPNKRPTALHALHHPWFQYENIALINSIHLNKLIARRHFGASNYDFIAGV